MHKTENSAVSAACEHSSAQNSDAGGRAHDCLQIQMHGMPLIMALVVPSVVPWVVPWAVPLVLQA